MFFLAISMVGTDFSMIGQLFPNRSRIEIKNKFKREEKLNSWRIDKAFKEKKPLDLDFFGELLTRVLEGEAKRKRERNGRDKNQTPRKSTTKRSRKSKKLKETESDPDDPDPFEADHELAEADDELAEADSNAVGEGTEESCSLEDAQNKEAIPKTSPVKHKRKWKKKDAAEPAEKEIAKESSEKDAGIRKSKCKVRQCKKGVQKGKKDNVGEPIAEGEDESHTVANVETLSDQGTSESKQPSQAKRKKQPSEEDKSLSDCESETLTGTTPPVTDGNSYKSQLAQPQKSKPNLKLIGKKKAGGKGGIKTAPKPSASYDDNVESGAGETESGAGETESGAGETESGAGETESGAGETESGAGETESGAGETEPGAGETEKSPRQDHNACHEEPTDIVIDKHSEKDVSNSLMPETTEADKPEVILSSKVQDSDTEQRPVEKPEEPRSKPGRPARNRFQKPKPNLGRAVVKKDVSTQERKIATMQESNIATQDIAGLNPGTLIPKASEAHEQMEDDAYFAPDARVLDNVPIQLEPVQNRSGGTNASIVPAFLSKSQSSDAASSESEKTSKYDKQNEQEELTLAAIQENIMSKPTRSGRLPKPTTFYNPSANQQPPATSTLLSEGENEGKFRSRPVRSHKAKPKVTKVLGKKEVQTKNTGKGQGATKVTLVTLRASQEEEDDDEPDVEEEDDIYPINPEEVNKAPAFVPISLRSPEPVQAQVEETMEELEIAINVSDENYTSEAEHSLLELHDKSEPSQSCTFIPEEDYYPTTADQIELFVEVIQVPIEDSVQEEEHCSAKLADGLQNAAYTDVICVDQKNLEEESVLSSDVPSLQIVVCSALSASDESSTESNRPNKQCVPAEKDLKGELDLQKPPLPKEDSTKSGFSSSSVTEEFDGAVRNKTRRRCRFPKPQPNLSKSTSRTHAIKLCPTTETEEMQSSVEPTETVLEKEKPGNKADMNPDDSLPIQLVATEGNEDNVTLKQFPAEQLSSKVLVSDEQDKCVSEEQMSKTRHLYSEAKHLGERLNLLISDEQDKCVGEEERMCRSEHQNSGSEHLGEKLNLFVSDEQDECVGEEERINRTEPMESGSQHLTEKLSLLMSDEQAKCVSEKEQMSKTEHPDNGVHDPDEELLTSDEQDKCVEEQVNMTEHLDDDTKHLHERVSPAHVQLHATVQSHDVQPGILSDTYFTQSTLTLCHTADPTLSIEATGTTPEVLCSGYSPKIDIKEAQNVEHQETLKTYEENFENLMAVENPKEETFILTLVEIPASSLAEYSESSCIPVSENTSSFAEPYLHLSAENTEIAVSSEPSVEAPTIPTLCESMPVIQSNLQQWDSNMPRMIMGQMDRKRKADNLSDNQNDSVKKSLVIASVNEDLRENVPQTEEIVQSNLATFTSPEDCPAPPAANTLGNYDIAQVSIPSESADNFTSIPLDDVLNPAPVERSTEIPSVYEEMRKSSRIRIGKVMVKPNFSTKRTTSTFETDLSARNATNNNILKLSESAQNAPFLLLSEDNLQTEIPCNSSVDMKSLQQEPGAGDDYGHGGGENEAQDAQEAATASESVCSFPETLAAVTDDDTVAGQSETSTQNTAPTSNTTLTRPGRKPRGFLSFISKKSSEGESEVKPKRMKFQKPRISLPQFTGKRPIPPAEDVEEMKASNSPPAKRKSCKKASGSQPNTKSAPTKVMCNSSLQSWQSESYTEEACCAVEQDTEQMLPTRVAEYFFSDIFTEVDEQE